MKRIHLILIGSALILFFVSCSTKKNKYLNKKYHAVTAEFNAIFNGEQALIEGKERLVEDYVDDFWEILPVERIAIPSIEEQEIGYSDTSNPTLFDRAEDKAVIAIQKHGMYIDGRERNPKMAEAYLLLGKARYYESRFIPAIDAFNFILTRYPSSKSINEANIWRAKTYVRLENEEVAIDLLKRTLADTELNNETIADASIMIAQAYIQMDSLPLALPYVQLAAEHVRDKEKLGRYRFIEGQLYNRLEKPDSATIAFDKVIDLHRRTLRDYYIHAHLAKIRNTPSTTEEEKEKLEKLLSKLENDRENRPYLDHIYYNIALYHHKQDSLDLAKKYYNKSIRAYLNDDKLQTKNYYTLAEMHFDEALYSEAGAYYDSTLTFMEPNTLMRRRTQKKRDNLEDVIKYENIAQVTDSIISLTRMSEGERLAYFTQYTDGLREKAIADSIAQAKRDKLLERGVAGTGGRRQQGESSSFYFYNPSQAAFGKQEFEQVWGRIALEDNWRLSNKRGGGIRFEDQEDVLLTEGGSMLDNPRFNPQVYIDAIPTDKIEIDSIVEQRNFAYYQLGLIYKEKFRENLLAADRLEQLLENKPEERLVLPAMYHLYRIYEEEGNSLGMSRMRDEILAEYPDSRYAEIIINPQASFGEDSNSPEYHYNQTYALYESQHYQEALNQVEHYLDRYVGDEIIPKFELLKAIIIGKTQGFTAYEEALNFVALNYLNTLEGKQAEKIYSEDLPKLAFNGFSSDNESNRWKLIYSFSNEESEEVETLKELLEEGLEELDYPNLKVSIDYYNPEISFVVVHGLRSRLGVQGLVEKLEEQEGIKINRKGFEVSSTNYAKILIHKNLEDYLIQNLN